jgi:hypothetical protein
MTSAFLEVVALAARRRGRDTARAMSQERDDISNEGGMS